MGRNQSRCMPFLRRKSSGSLHRVRYPIISRVGENSLAVVVEAAPPIPEEKELNEKFSELVDELDLTATHRKAMFDMPPEKKWQLYLTKHEGQRRKSSAGPSKDYLTQLHDMVRPGSSLQLEAKTEFFDELRTALRTQPMKFVSQFLEGGGLRSLITFLEDMDYEACNSTAHLSIIGCFKALMNNSYGRGQVLASSDYINVIAQSLITQNIKAKVAVLEILGACCMVPGGHRKVLDAFSHFQSFAEERARFQLLVIDLDRTYGSNQYEFSLKIAIMSFINASLRYGAGSDSLEFRVHLRYEFLMLGLQSIMDKLRRLDNAILNRHLDYFEMIRMMDEKELADRFHMLHVDAKSASGLLDALRTAIGHTTCFTHLLSVLKHLLLIPVDPKQGMHQYWCLIDLLVQQVVLQQEGNIDPDRCLGDFKFREIILRLKEDELRGEGSLKGTKRDQEMTELQSTLSKMADKLELETKEVSALRKRNEELADQLSETQNKLVYESAEVKRLQTLFRDIGCSISDDAKISNMLSSLVVPPANGLPPPPPVPSIPSIPLPAPPVIPAPPPTMLMAPPIPPSIGVFQAPSRHKESRVPRPTNPLKSFNWSKIPESKLKGTLWAEIDDSRIIPLLNFLEIDQTFSAYQRKESTAKDETDDDSKRDKPKELCFLDNRRAQNISILLAKLVVPIEEMYNVVMAMDADELLSKDTLEQLLKYVPSPDEQSLLQLNAKDYASFAKAERFLYEVSNILHYEQRLKALLLKTIFNEKMAELKPKVECMTKACIQLTRSRRLQTLLEIILAIGNYMNTGTRGNASGFKLCSLNKIIDTKSSTDSKITLLNYVLDLLERKFSDVFCLEDDLPDLRSACKVNVSEVYREIHHIRNALKEVEKELEFHLKHKDRTLGDRYWESMSGFAKVASFSLAELESMTHDMNERIERTMQHFGEDPKQTQPDEFFDVFNSFLTSFAEAKGENLILRKRKEDEDRRAREVVEHRERAVARKTSVLQGGELDRGRSIDSKQGDFDDLISALRTGDVFGEEISRYRGRKRSSKLRPTLDQKSPEDRERSQRAIAYGSPCSLNLSQQPCIEPLNQGSRSDNVLLASVR